MDRVQTGYVALAATAVAILLSAGLPGTAWADNDPAAEILKAAETVAVGDATPADAEVPVPRVDGDAVTVDLDASDLEVTLGNSAEATISESGQYAIVEDASVTYAEPPRRGNHATRSDPCGPDRRTSAVDVRKRHPAATSR